MSTTYLVPATYASVNLAHAAIPTNLSGTGIHIIEISAGTLVGDLEISGNTNASSVDYIIIQPASGDEHNGQFGVGVILNGDHDIEVPFTRFLNIEVLATPGTAFFVPQSANDCLIKNVLLNSGAIVGNGFIVDGDDSKIINCIAWRTTSESVRALYNSSASSSGVEFINCGSFGPWFVGCNGSSNSSTVYTNCWSYDGTLDFDDVSLGSNNWSKDNTAFGTSSLINQTLLDAKFVDDSNGDFDTAEDSTLQDAGLDQSSVYTNDIAGNLIPPSEWPIGPFYTGAPAPSSGDGFSIGMGFSI